MNAIFGAVGVVAALTFAGVTRTQTPGKQAAEAAKATGSVADLSGVYWAAGLPPELRARKDVVPPEKDQADFFTLLHSPYPLQPWAQEKFNYNRAPDNPYVEGRAELNPSLAICSPEGVTGGWQDFYPFEIIQSPKRVLIMFELNHEIRQIWTDGRPHPKDFGHTWMGHTIGHWEGDTLVADTIGLNDIPWLDKAGHVHSDALHIIERFQRVKNILWITMTFDDPKAFTMPFTTRKSFELRPNWDLEEAFLCEDRYLGKGIPLN
jgi:hypothetical protein